MAADFRNFLVRTKTSQCADILRGLNESDSKFYSLTEARIARINSHEVFCQNLTRTHPRNLHYLDLPKGLRSVIVQSPLESAS